MEWVQVLSLFLANAGFVIWRRMDNKIDAMHAEMKDFHDRLIKVEMSKK